MNKKLYFLLALLGTTALFGELCGKAEASLESSIVLNGALHGIQDTSAEVAYREDILTGTWSEVAGPLLADDVLVAGVGFDSLEIVLGPTTVLTGVNALSMLKIATVVPTGVNPQGVPLASFTFHSAPVSDWTGILDTIYGGAGLAPAALIPSPGDGTIGMLFDGASSDFDRTAPPFLLMDSIDTIFSPLSPLPGAYAEIGFTGGAAPGGGLLPNGTGEGWAATAPLSLSSATLFALNTGILGTSYNAAVSRLEGFAPVVSFDPLATPFALGGLADIVGGGTTVFYGDGSGGPVGPWQAGDDADFSFRPLGAIPEPASIACWLGLAAAAGGIGARRSRERRLR